MNMFLHELRAYRKSTIIWTCAVCGLIILYLSLFPGFAQDAAELKKLLSGYPVALQRALGIISDNIASLVGFYSFTFVYVLLCGAIQAMNLGTSLLSKEVREKTADFLLTKPVTRPQIITAKLLAALTSLAITNVIYLVVANIMVLLVKDGSYDTKVFFLISFSLILVQLFFLALGTLVSVVMPRIKSVIAVSLSTVFGFFIISMLGSALGDENVRYITPFKYYDASYIINNAAYETRFVVIEVIFLVLAIVASYVIYSKKDIHAV